MVIQAAKNRWLYVKGERRQCCVLPGKLKRGSCLIQVTTEIVYDKLLGTIKICWRPPVYRDHLCVKTNSVPSLWWSMYTGLSIWAKYDASWFVSQGDRFGGALDAAAKQFSEALDGGIIPMEFVNTMRKKGKLIMGIGHRVKSVSTFGVSGTFFVSWL